MAAKGQSCQAKTGVFARGANMAARRFGPHRSQAPALKKFFHSACCVSEMRRGRFTVFFKNRNESPCVPLEKHVGRPGPQGERAGCRPAKAKSPEPLPRKGCGGEYRRRKTAAASCWPKFAVLHGHLSCGNFNVAMAAFAFSSATLKKSALPGEREGRFDV